MRLPDPAEDLELEEAIERIRRNERRRRKQHRRFAAVGVLVTTIVLAIGAWLVLWGQMPTWSLRMAQPTSASNLTTTPSTPEPPALDEGATPPAAAEPATAREAHAPPAVASSPEPAPAPARAVERDLPPRASPAREPARPLPRARDLTPPPPPPRAQPEVSALPSRAGVRAAAEVRVDVATEPLADGLTRYTVRLRERDGQPVVDATVSIRGRRADGALLEAMLDRGGEPGAYHAVVRRPVDLTDARLRVASISRVQEVPLPDAPR